MIYSLVNTYTHISHVSPFLPPPTSSLMYLLETSLSLTATDDHSRVVLYERDENGSDYINAAYIDVSYSIALFTTSMITPMHARMHTYTSSQSILHAPYIMVLE